MNTSDWLFQRIRWFRAIFNCVKSYLGLLCFCITSLCDWSSKFASLTLPIRCKTKTTHDLVVAFSRSFGSLVVFTLTFHWHWKVSPFFLITLVSVLRHSRHARPIKSKTTANRHVITLNFPRYHSLVTANVHRLLVVLSLLSYWPL